MRDTEGAGVTIVMNSLMAPGYKETSLGICAPRATFVEVAKLDIFTAEEVHQMRPDVNYRVIDISAVSIGYIQELRGAILPKFDSGTYKALPSTTYALTQLKAALNYFRATRHIGKVVIKMPHLCSDLGGRVWLQKMFNQESAYLITGGLGGIGMEVDALILCLLDVVQLLRLHRNSSTPGMRQVGTFEFTALM